MWAKLLAIVCLLTRDKTLFLGLLDDHISTKAKAMSYTKLTTEICSIQKRRKIQNMRHFIIINFILIYYLKFALLFTKYLI